MSSIWPLTVEKKLFLTALGMAVILVTSTPQTPEAASAYLAGRGYTGVRLKAPAPYYGRGAMRFPFEARDADGKRVSGELSLGSFAWFYKVTLNNPQPK